MLEHFNYRHSSLRMKVECAFGQLKKRWKVLKTMPQMLPKYQMSIIVSCFTLYNFIRMYKLDIPIVQHDAVIGRTNTNLDDKDRMSLMSKVRMDIAKAIWKDNNPEEHEDGVSQNDNEEEHMEVDDPNN
ncbi:uncharacterized protein LOC141647716 [Silene latifolia]|uniref:uncharacterized protein LOC141647716 n=1 Tax=Silene latifolia TaxID=37657 RepID=UPI003D770C36